VDSRQDGKRFPGCLKEIARPSPYLGDGLFVLNILSIASNKMIKQLCFRITLATFALCLCLGSQAVLPIFNVDGVPLLNVAEIDFEQTEFEEDFLTTIIAEKNIDRMFSKPRHMNLEFQASCVVPVFSPPKHA
jgi:hypothetical protein